MSHLRTQAAVSPFYELRSEAVAEVVRPRARHAGLFRVELIRRPAMDAQAASKRSRMSHAKLIQARLEHKRSLSAINRITVTRFLNKF